MKRPCLQDWTAMEGDAQRRHCGVCGKDVHDLSTMDPDQAMAVYASGACVRFARDASGRVLYASALGLALSAAVSSPALASTAPAEGLPWWARARDAVYAWWYGEPVYERIEPHSFVMGDPAPVDPFLSEDRVLQVTVPPGPPGPLSMEVNCAQGFRKRAPFHGNQAQMLIPPGQCQLTFQGRASEPVRLGEELDLYCTFSEDQADCKPN